MRNDQDERKANLKLYGKYGGMVANLVAVILIGVYLGRYLDGLVGTNQPFITIGLIMVGLIAAITRIYKQISED